MHGSCSGLSCGERSADHKAQLEGETAVREGTREQEGAKERLADKLGEQDIKLNPHTLLWIKAY